MSKTILIMAGGTGGHVFPALAVADFLRAKQWNVVWLGTQNGMEARLVPARGYDMEYVSMSGVRGNGIVKWLLLPFSLLRAFMQAVGVIRRRKPDVVLGMGGYASFPGGMMASLLNKPLVLHEQNSVAGLTNRVLALVADKILAGFPDAFSAATGNTLGKLLPKTKSAQWCGNPVRSDIAALPEPEKRFATREGNLRVLVIGGSQGAKALNEALPAAFKLIPMTQRPEVVHQAGASHIEAVKAGYQSAEVHAEVLPFIDDMAARYGWCDLLVCRAGALTVAEITAAGVASVLVPFPAAVDDHQTGNAKFLSNAGAAILLPQAEATPQKLADIFTSLSREKLLFMANAARKLAKPDATQIAAETCMQAAA
jgi:UDP-N-acetylglucosamine--N-acetylmuramyl-(pentapeptide) pyrophosphoryl-undecaprenol N-acetylglucosamine transferase